MPFVIGQRVRRLEDREVTGATVLSIKESPRQNDSDTTIVEIQYDEGGSGWWPEKTLVAE